MSTGLTRLRPTLRADAAPEQLGIDPSVAAQLVKRNRTHRLVPPSMCSTVADFERVAFITIVLRAFNLVGPVGALDAAAQPVHERLVASRTRASALAKVDAQS